MHPSYFGYLFSFSLGEFVFIAWLLAYTALMIWLYTNYNRLKITLGGDHLPLNVALIIPFRNEAINVQRLAIQLAAYIPSSWEIIWVDDHSEDSSLYLLTSWIKAHGYSSWRVFSAPGAGKKSALQTGITAASAEIIVTTDADVILSPHAFSQLLLPFTDTTIQLVAGPVISQNGKGFYAAFQHIEWASILLVTGAFFGIGRPLMCSGANLAFRKQAFIEVKGYEGNEQVLSGDDEFLLKKIIKKYGSPAAVFFANEKSLVFVPPAKSVKELLQQRMRWASKWRSHGSSMHASSAILAVVFTLFPYLSVLFYLNGALTGWMLGTIWIGKFVCDKLILGRILRSLGLNSTWIDYAITTILHPSYVLAVSLGVFKGGFEWKGRKSKYFH